VCGAQKNKHVFHEKAADMAMHTCTSSTDPPITTRRFLLAAGMIALPYLASISTRCVPILTPLQRKSTKSCVFFAGEARVDSSLAKNAAFCLKAPRAPPRRRQISFTPSDCCRTSTAHMQRAAIYRAQHARVLRAQGSE
jgi:hypothetical protein